MFLKMKTKTFKNNTKICVFFIVLSSSVSFSSGSFIIRSNTRHKFIKYSLEKQDLQCYNIDVVLKTTS